MEAFVEAVKAGIGPVDFWGLTPYLTRKATPALHDGRTTGAWIVASLIRTKKMPKLTELISKKKDYRSKGEMEEDLKAHLMGMTNRKK